MKKEKQTTNSFLQRLFIASAVGMYLVQVGFQLYQAIVQYQDNPNLSSFYWLFGYIAVLPLMFFLVAYCLNTRKGFKQAILFENLLLMTIGMNFFSVVDLLVQQLRIHFLLVQDSFWNWIVQEAILAALAVVCFSLLLLQARRSKQW